MAHLTIDIGSPTLRMTTHGWLFWEEHLQAAFEFLFEDKTQE